MVTFTTEIQTLLAAITSISLYCEQLKLGPTCSILTKYYQPNKNEMNVYGFFLPSEMNGANSGGINGTLLRTFKTDANLQLYFPDVQYLGNQKALLHTFERTTRKVNRRDRTGYSIFTYSNDSPKINQGEFLPAADVKYDFCFSNMNEFYCIFYNQNDTTFRLSRQPDSKAKEIFFTSDGGKIKFFAFDYCTSSLIFDDGENNFYLMNLYNMVEDIKDINQTTKIPKSEYNVTFCHQGGGRLKSTPMFLTTFANATELESKRSEIGLIDFEICYTSITKTKKPGCLPVTAVKEKEIGFFENSGNLIWTIVCGIGLIAVIIMVVITVVYYLKKRDSKKVYKEIGTETYMGITATQSPTAPKKGKGKVPPPPPKQLEMTTPTVGQSQESVKPQSTLLITDF
uniref:Uncharacterized protein n=1 Tax=Panagrolaimus sp. ES5 TaxID=591445 RepID=A0AC34F9Q9_9BILA